MSQEQINKANAGLDAALEGAKIRTADGTEFEAQDPEKLYRVRKQLEAEARGNPIRVRKVAFVSENGNQ